MTDEARERLMEAVAGAVDAYVEDVSPREEPDTGHMDEDWGRPMDYDEFDDLCVWLPTSLISHVTGLSQGYIRNMMTRQKAIPPDVASKMRRLNAIVQLLASEQHRNTRGRPRKSSQPPDTGKRQQKKRK